MDDIVAACQEEHDRETAARYAPLADAPQLNPIILTSPPGPPLPGICPACGSSIER